MGLNLPDPQRYPTTNAIENGMMRQLREMRDGAGSFGRQTGAKAAPFLTVHCLNTTLSERSWSDQIPPLLQTSTLKL